MSKTETNQPTISAKIAQLDSATEWFYGDDFMLDQALDKYQAATKLAAEIDHDLKHLENQVRVVADFTQE